MPEENTKHYTEHNDENNLWNNANFVSESTVKPTQNKPVPNKHKEWLKPA